ncbi:MAG: hypothetical protein WCK18_15810 [Prolixibacteraceae bacterium]
MGLQKGRTNNPHGRPKGKQNKVTTSTKQWIQTIIDSSREQLEADLKKLDPGQRWAVAEKLLSYVIPKQQATSATIEFSQLGEEQIDQIINDLTQKLK